MKKIKLMAIDIDGCLTRGEGQNADLDVLRQVQAFNHAAASDPDVPDITLCTGRQQPYADLMCQVLGVRIPAVFENGAGLHVPEPYDFLFHPDVTAEKLAALAALKAAITETLVARGETRIQPGKEASLSIYPTHGYSVEHNAKILREIMEERGLEFDLDVSLLCVNILLPGFDKSTGLRWLAERQGLELDEIGAVGDAPGDLCYLEISGFAAVPANAVQPLKDISHYVADSENGRGVIEIIEQCIKRNKKAG